MASSYSLALDAYQVSPGCPRTAYLIDPQVRRRGLACAEHFGIVVPHLQGQPVITRCTKIPSLAEAFDVEILAAVIAP